MSACKAPDIVAQCFEGEAVIVDLRTNRIFHLNETAGRIWQLLESGCTFADVKAALLDEYQALPSQLDEDLSGLLAAMKRERLIVAFH
jgi:hypothetical protein